jgi:MFS family permease
MATTTTGEQSIGVADPGEPVPPEASARAEWRQHWTVVLAGAMGIGVATVSVYATGVFIAPLEQEFGWSRAQISSGQTVMSVFSLLLGPVIGLAVDRFGPRRIGIAGVIAYCAGLASFSLTGPSIWSWWGLWVLLALAAMLIKPTVWTAGVSSMFSAGRGMALSVMLCGTALGSSLTPLVSNWLIDAYGWRTAFVGLGLFWAMLVVPPVFLFFTSAKDRHRTGVTQATAVRDIVGVSAREGFLSLTFAKLTIAACVTTIVIVSFTTNLVPILSSQGLTRQEAAGVAGIIGLATVVGRLTGGFLLDRVNGSVVGGVSVALPIISASLLLSFPGDPAMALLAVLVLGLSLGVELDAVAYLATRHFGMRNFGLLFGTISGMLALATGLGPLLVSLVYDHYGSYRPALIAYIPGCILASAMFFAMGKYPVFDKAIQPEGY